jgi:putative endonuclease
MTNNYFEYILSSKPNGTLYTGFTSDLLSRVYEHKNDIVKGFTKKYGIHKLVYFEQCDDYDAAPQREKQKTNGKGIFYSLTLSLAAIRHF